MNATLQAQDNWPKNSRETVNFLTQELTVRGFLRFQHTGVVQRR